MPGGGANKNHTKMLSAVLNVSQTLQEKQNMLGTDGEVRMNS